jgi:hypothetical protein
MGSKIVFAVACWLFLLGIVVQVFLAGAGLFKLTDFTAHGSLGWSLPLISLFLPILAYVAHVEKSTVGLAGAIVVLTFIQPELAAARHTDPLVAAFHPVNALLIFWLTWTVARRATELARAERRQPVAATD